MDKIKCITEAYVRDGKQWTVRNTSDGYYDPAYACKEIKLEMVQLGSDSSMLVYIGYNFQNQKIFQYLADSVNVEYEPPFKNNINLGTLLN